MSRTLFRTLAVLLLVCDCVPGLAATPVGGVLACRAISQSAARLACFDRESARLASARAAAAAPGTGASSRKLGPRQTFGLPEGTIEAREITAGVRARPLAHISARVARLSQSADGRLVFALDNGQVWMELLPDHDLLARVGETATISRQLFGSYWMQLQSGRGCKVTRVR